MILVDANLLLYASVDRFPRHEAARAWLAARLGGRERVGLAWSSLLAFLRIATSGRMLDPPMPSSFAASVVSTWLARPNVWVPRPTERHWTVLSDVIEESRASGALIPDAHLAALSIEHGLLVCSCDSDFARFDGVRWEDPLRASV